MRYDSTEYANSRLAGTIVKYQGEAVYVSECFGERLAKIRVLPHGNEDAVNLDHLDLSPIKLGYVNIGGCAEYLQRIPKRRDWRQGLRANNVNNAGVLEEGVAFLVNPTYPTPDKVVDRVFHCSDESMAFSRHFSVRYDGCIRHKGRQSVGEVCLDDEDHASWKLYDDFLHLEEALKEALDEHKK